MRKFKKGFQIALWLISWGNLVGSSFRFSFSFPFSLLVLVWNVHSFFFFNSKKIEEKNWYFCKEACKVFNGGLWLLKKIKKLPQLLGEMRILGLFQCKRLWLYFIGFFLPKRMVVIAMECNNNGGHKLTMIKAICTF